MMLLLRYPLSTRSAHSRVGCVYHFVPLLANRSKNMLPSTTIPGVPLVSQKGPDIPVPDTAVIFFVFSIAAPDSIVFIQVRQAPQKYPGYRSTHTTEHPLAVMHALKTLVDIVQPVSPLVIYQHRSICFSVIAALLAHVTFF